MKYSEIIDKLNITNSNEPANVIFDAGLASTTALYFAHQQGMRDTQAIIICKNNRLNSYVKMSILFANHLGISYKLFDLTHLPYTKESLRMMEVACACEEGKQIITTEYFTDYTSISLALGYNLNCNVYNPFEYLSLEEIIYLGNQLNVNWSMTFVCHKSHNEVPCGKCTNCINKDILL